MSVDGGKISLMRPSTAALLKKVNALPEDERQAFVQEMIVFNLRQEIGRRTAERALPAAAKAVSEKQVESVVRKTVGVRAKK